MIQDVIEESHGERNGFDDYFPQLQTTIEVISSAIAVVKNVHIPHRSIGTEI